MPDQEKQQLCNIYKGGFFKNRHKMMWRVPIFCDAVIDVFRPESVIDMGCAIGDFVKGLADKGITSLGVEGSIACKPFLVSPAVIFKDLREPLNPGFNFPFDLCMCLEVAEHIEPEYSTMLVKNLCSVSSNVLISAAPPGQKGHHHVNCQEIEYWDNRFMDFNYVRDDSKSDEVIKLLSGYKHKPGIKAYCENLHFYTSIIPVFNKKEKPCD
jgi:hypothetical protein